MTEHAVQYGSVIAIIGKPNVGKSTLLNQLLGKKLSITANKPQTTRHAVVSQIPNTGQIITYVDTPGLQYEYHNLLTKQMNQMVKHYVQTADVLLWMVNAYQRDAADQTILDLCKTQTKPVILLINKIDKLANKNDLLPCIQAWAEAFDFAAIVPISAKKKLNLESLQKLLTPYLHAVKNNTINPAHDSTDKKQHLCEMIREKIFRFTGDEIPYSSAVTLDSMKYIKGVCHIKASIQVMQINHKKMMIGHQGRKLKQIGTHARLALQEALNQRVHLQLWVEVQPDWMQQVQLWHIGSLPSTPT